MTLTVAAADDSREGDPALQSHPPPFHNARFAGTKGLQRAPVLCLRAVALTAKRPTVVRNLLLPASGAADDEGRKTEKTSPAQDDRFGPPLVSIAALARRVTQGCFRKAARFLRQKICRVLHSLCSDWPRSTCPSVSLEKRFTGLKTLRI